MRKNYYLNTVLSLLNFDVPKLFLVVAHQDQEGTTQVHFQKAAVWPVTVSAESLSITATSAGSDI